GQIRTINETAAVDVHIQGLASIARCWNGSRDGWGWISAVGLDFEQVIARSVIAANRDRNVMVAVEGRCADRDVGSQVRAIGRSNRIVIDRNAGVVETDGGIASKAGSGDDHVLIGCATIQMLRIRVCHGQRWRRWGDAEITSLYGRHSRSGTLIVPGNQKVSVVINCRIRFKSVAALQVRYKKVGTGCITVGIKSASQNII